MRSSKQFASRSLALFLSLLTVLSTVGSGLIASAAETSLESSGQQERVGCFWTNDENGNPMVWHRSNDESGAYPHAGDKVLNMQLDDAQGVHWYDTYCLEPEAYLPAVGSTTAWYKSWDQVRRDHNLSMSEKDFKRTISSIMTMGYMDDGCNMSDMEDNGKYADNSKWGGYKYIATQTLIWEVATGERTSLDQGFVRTGSNFYNCMMSIRADGNYCGTLMEKFYKRIEAAVKKIRILPKFSGTTIRLNNDDLGSDGKYRKSITDGNYVFDQCIFSNNNTSCTYTKDGASVTVSQDPNNKYILNIVADKNFSGSIEIKGKKGISHNYPEKAKQSAGGIVLFGTEGQQTVAEGRADLEPTEFKFNIKKLFFKFYFS